MNFRRGARFIEAFFSRINGSMYYLTSTLYKEFREEELKARLSQAFEVHQVKSKKRIL